jgi:hypothetical protein
MRRGTAVLEQHPAKPIVRHVPLLLVLLGCSGPSIEAHAQVLLDAAEVRKLIVGNTVDGHRPNGTRYLAYFDPSGKWIRGEPGRYAEGRWLIHDDGTQCVILANEESCARIQKNDDGTYTRIEQGRPQFRWSRVIPGKAF